MEQLNVNARDNKGYTALHIAIHNQNVGVVELLLKANANVNDVVRETGQTPLHIAIAQKNQDIVKLLLSLNLNYNAVDKQQKNCLHYAAAAGVPEILSMLLPKVKNKNATDKTGNTPLHVAIQNDHTALVKLLLQAKVSTSIISKSGRTPLHEAVLQRNLRIVEALSKVRASVTVTDKEGLSPLHYAAAQGDGDILQVLFRVSNSNKSSRDRDGNTLLMTAVKKGHHEVVTLLLKYGADCNTRDGAMDADTPLHVAVRDKRLDIVKSLVQCKAKVNGTTSYSANTPLHYAVEVKDVDICQFLIENKANVDQLNKEKRSPRDLARDTNFDFQKGCLKSITTSSKDSTVVDMSTCKIEGTEKFGNKDMGGSNKGVQSKSKNCSLELECDPEKLPEFMRNVYFPDGIPVKEGIKEQSPISDTAESRSGKRPPKFARDLIDEAIKDLESFGEAQALGGEDFPVGIVLNHNKEIVPWCKQESNNDKETIKNKEEGKESSSNKESESSVGKGKVGKEKKTTEYKESKSNVSKEETNVAKENVKPATKGKESNSSKKKESKADHESRKSSPSNALSNSPTKKRNNKAQQKLDKNSPEFAKEEDDKKNGDSKELQDQSTSLKKSQSNDVASQDRNSNCEKSTGKSSGNLQINNESKEQEPPRLKDVDLAESRSQKEIKVENTTKSIGFENKNTSKVNVEKGGHVKEPVSVKAKKGNVEKNKSHLENFDSDDKNENRKVDKVLLDFSSNEKPMNSEENEDNPQIIGKSWYEIDEDKQDIAISEEALNKMKQQQSDAHKDKEQPMEASGGDNVNKGKLEQRDYYSFDSFDDDEEAEYEEDDEESPLKDSEEPECGTEEEYYERREVPYRGRGKDSEEPECGTEEEYYDRRELPYRGRGKDSEEPEFPSEEEYYERREVPYRGRGYSRYYYDKPPYYSGRGRPLNRPPRFQRTEGQGERGSYPPRPFRYQRRRGWGYERRPPFHYERRYGRGYHENSRYDARNNERYRRGEESEKPMCSDCRNAEENQDSTIEKVVTNKETLPTKDEEPEKDSSPQPQSKVVTLNSASSSPNNTTEVPITQSGSRPESMPSNWKPIQMVPPLRIPGPYGPMMYVPMMPKPRFPPVCSSTQTDHVGISTDTQPEGIIDVSNLPDLFDKKRILDISLLEAYKEKELLVRLGGGLRTRLEEGEELPEWISASTAFMLLCPWMEVPLPVILDDWLFSLSQVDRQLILKVMVLYKFLTPQEFNQFSLLLRRLLHTCSAELSCESCKDEVVKAMMQLAWQEIYVAQLMAVSHMRSGFIKGGKVTEEELWSTWISSFDGGKHVEWAAATKQKLDDEKLRRRLDISVARRHQLDVAHFLNDVVNKL